MAVVYDLGAARAVRFLRRASFADVEAALEQLGQLSAEARERRQAGRTVERHELATLASLAAVGRALVAESQGAPMPIVRRA
ncbi:conserved protein of unknown function [Rhodovastum atsumiense]|uniref:Uncharacterized protein n=1 Tax=Rhodovastum atsumiense TaxID=504468 RepID=A0A5M6IPT9_9PROT|nr:hypothetical protein [Rhodovastum atsumiense]KAA5610300.1 hypothetical protein F1189_20175 [Rhodovastum atsumiense]CAH2602211.1 conserved protein of unknown function [Rhodovastum atsumiense]